MKNVSIASAPGKIHLIGEHSAVYGKPAILAAINRKVVVTVSKKLHQGKPQGVKTRESFKKIQEYLHDRYRIPMQELFFDVRSDIPVGRGLGSSAALSAAISCALHNMYDLPIDLDSIFESAYEGEKFFHGNPSGGDLAVSVHGGLIWFRKETELVKITKKLELKRSLKLFAIDTGKPVESTKDMVMGVGRMNKKKVLIFCQEQEQVSKMFADALIKNDIRSANELMKLAGDNLVALGIVGRRAQVILNKLKLVGIFAKVSGGGGIKKGSGMIVGLTPKKNQLGNICSANGWDFLELDMENEGVKVESHE